MIGRRVHAATLVAAATAFASSVAIAAPIAGWQSARASLEAKGISPGLIYDSALISDLDGGVKRGTVHVGNVHAQLQLDGGKLVGAPGITVYLDALDVHGGNPDALVGDAQGLSNIAAPPQFELYEAWLQYNTPGSAFSVLAGQYDVNSEFDRLRSAGLFLNSSFGVGPAFSSSGRAGPSIFPNTSLGIRLAFRPAANVVLRTAILDGVPVTGPPGVPGPFDRNAGVLLISELSLRSRPGAIMPPSNHRSLVRRTANRLAYRDKLALGAWYYTASFPDLSEIGANGLPVHHRGSAGVYLDIDKLLYQAPGRAGGMVRGFLQLGYGDGLVDRFGSYIGLGVTADGLVPGRPKDEIGLAAAIGRGGSHFLAAQAKAGVPTAGTETAIEFTYLAQVTSWLAIQPDLQYIIDPGNDPRIGDALVFQLECEVSV